MERPGIAFGVLAILAGAGVGYLMLAFPEGANPAYPIWIALLVPLAFVLGGVLMLAHALGYSSLSTIAVTAFALCLLAIVNWAAFVAGHVQCRVIVSFLGSAILAKYPSESECRESLRVVIACIDLVVLVPVLVFAWRKMAGAARSPTR